MDNIVIITGTSKGIGKAIAELFLKKDFIVYGLDRLEASLENKNYHHVLVDLFKDELPNLPALYYPN